MSPVSKRIQIEEIMEPEELANFMLKQGLTEKELADILGMKKQSVHLWLIGERAISTPNTRLIRLFIKYPALLKEF